MTFVTLWLWAECKTQDCDFTLRAALNSNKQRNVGIFPTWETPNKKCQPRICRLQKMPFDSRIFGTLGVFQFCPTFVVGRPPLHWQKPLSAVTPKRRGQVMLALKYSFSLWPPMSSFEDRDNGHIGCPPDEQQRWSISSILTVFLVKFNYLFPNIPGTIPLLLSTNALVIAMYEIKVTRVQAST